MKSLVVGILLAALALVVCPARGLCQTTDQTTTAGKTDAEEQPTQQEPREDPAEEPVYDSSKPIPTGYVLEKRPHPALLISGGATLGASYAYTLLLAIHERQDPEHATVSPGWLLLPVLGPFIAAATAHDSCGTTGSGNGRAFYCQHADRGGLAVLGGIQAAGLVLATGAYVAPRKRLVRANVTVAPLPMGYAGYGLSLSGRL
jgi:hypothetical protein